MHFTIAESNNCEHNLTFNEKDALCVPYVTKNISHNIETDRTKKKQCHYKNYPIMKKKIVHT